jgi:hypothetical protein
MPEEVGGERRRSSSIELSFVEFVRHEIEQSQRLSEAERNCLRELVEERFKAIHAAREAANRELEQRIAVHEKHFEEFFRDYGEFKESTNTTLANYAGRTIVLGGIVAIALAILMRFWK